MGCLQLTVLSLQIKIQDQTKFYLNLRLIMNRMAKVDVYTTDYCPFCDMAKALLTKKGVPFTNHDVSSDSKTRAWLEEQSGQRTVPQIFINDQSIGGFTELAALQRSGELDKLLSPTG